MKVLVIGASGTIGTAVVAALKERHEVIGASRNGGDMRADLADMASIRALFERAGKVDAVVSAAGEARFKPLADLTDDDFAFSLANKLMGQVNLARIAAAFVNEGGSITLTAGSLAQEPSVGSGAVSLVNAGLEGFRAGGGPGARAQRYPCERGQPAVGLGDARRDGQGPQGRPAGGGGREGVRAERGGRFPLGGDPRSP